MSNKKTAINALSIATILGVALMYAAKIPAVRIAGLILCISSFLAAFLLWKLAWKCPHCGKHLGRIDNSDRCPYCGKNIYE